MVEVVHIRMVITPGVAAAVVLEELEVAEIHLHQVELMVAQVE